MKPESESDDLGFRPRDASIAAVRGGLSAIPFLGSPLGEIIGITIPNQRLDRVVRFCRLLNRRLNAVEKSFLESRLRDESFTDLIEEGIIQAARSLSDERRNYIASVIISGLTSDDIQASESRHLLRILNEINDIEVVWLQYYSDSYIEEDEEFTETHKEILQPVIALMGSPQEELNKATLQDSYKEHLCQLGLLEHQYQIDNRTGIPEFNSTTGSLEVSEYRMTSLGELLINEIGLGKESGTL